MNLSRFETEFYFEFFILSDPYVCACLCVVGI